MKAGLAVLTALVKCVGFWSVFFSAKYPGDLLLAPAAWKGSVARSLVGE
jgi:hypothetical protein